MFNEGKDGLRGGFIQTEYCSSICSNLVLQKANLDLMEVTSITLSYNHALVDTLFLFNSSFIIWINIVDICTISSVMVILDPNILKLWSTIFLYFTKRKHLLKLFFLPDFFRSQIIKIFLLPSFHLFYPVRHC